MTKHNGRDSTGTTSTTILATLVLIAVVQLPERLGWRHRNPFNRWLSAIFSLKKSGRTCQISRGHRFAAEALAPYTLCLDVRCCAATKRTCLINWIKRTCAYTVLTSVNGIARRWSFENRQNVGSSKLFAEIKV